jgi:hypothetical protein
LEFISPTPDSGRYLDTITIRARLTSEDAPLADQYIKITLAAQQRTAKTDQNGEAQVDFVLLDRPDLYTLQAAFAGDATYEGATASQPFDFQKQPTYFTGPASVAVKPGTDTGFVVTLHDRATPAGIVPNRSIFFIVHGPNGNYAKKVATNHLGQADLGMVPLPAGKYAIDTYFGMTVPLNPPLDFEDKYYEGSSLMGVPLTLGTKKHKLTGFLQPVTGTGHESPCDDDCPISVFKGGATIPIKFEVRDEDGKVVQLSSPPIWLVPQRGNPISSGTPGNFPAAVSSGIELRQSGKHYSYNWSTKGLATGYYWRIGVMLEDGQTFYVIIILK